MKPSPAALILPLALLATLSGLVACDDSTDGAGGSTSSSTTTASSTSASGSTTASGSTSASGAGSTTSSSTGSAMGTAKFGDACVSGSDCMSGVCIDVKDADNACTSGKYCTIPCTGKPDCTALGAEDCDPVNAVGVCLESDWLAAHGCG